MSNPWDGKCGRRNKNCRKCGHRFTKAEYELWNCPECGEDRHCTANPHRGRKGGACRRHGGANPSGIAANHFTTGRHSTHFPAGQLRDRFNAALADPNLTSAKEQVAALDVRMSQLEERLGTGESGAAWKMLKAAWAELQESQAAARKAKQELDAGDESAQQRIAAANQRSADALTNIGRIINDGSAGEKSWNELTKYTERFVALKESEARIRQTEKLNLPVEVVMVWCVDMARALREHVSDRKALQAIMEVMQRLMGGSVGGSSEQAKLPQAAPNDSQPQTIDVKAKPSDGSN